jgi:diaminopimelate epimerase
LIQFAKYHGLGNDYLVIEPEALPAPLSLAQITQICDRHYGPGSDGILLGPLPTNQADFGLRIFNPDGSEAEKSGNGLRIFVRYLWDSGRLEKQRLAGGSQGSLPFSILTPGGKVLAQVLENGELVRVEMGQAVFDSASIPVTGPARQVVDEILPVGGEELHFCAVSLGNPHCVVLYPGANSEIAHRLGPLIENHAIFPRRTNVQFLGVIDRQNLRIEIWERGAGYTLASGSSSCAASAAAYRLGLCDQILTVHNPGGRLSITIGPDYSLTLTGPVVKVYTGLLENN